MAKVRTCGLVFASAAFCALGLAGPANAQVGVGTWVRQDFDTAHGEMTMIVEPCCGAGRRLTYHLGDTGVIMVIESPFDGSEAPVLIGGKPSGETMAITLVDPHHTSTIIKMNGKPFAISKATLSDDGRTLTVVNEQTGSAGGNPAGKQTEVWVRK